MSARGAVRIEPWGAQDLALLQALVGDPVMTEHVGGPETAEKIAERQARYEQPGSNQFVIVEPGGARVGWAGFWTRSWCDENVYEMGWAVLPAFQGLGIAGAGTALVVEAARAQAEHRYLHAFPSIENAPSNGICRKVGFTLLGAVDFEYPPGTWMRCNDWRLDLLGERSPNVTT